MCRRLVAVAALALGVSAAGGLALARAAVSPSRVVVAPAAGVPATVFVVSFKAPERTGNYGATERHDLLRASAPSSGRGCVTNVNLRTPDARKGHHVRVLLAPRRLGGRWCSGVYHGQIEELETAVCPRHELCPTFVILRGTVGRFAFRVNVNRPLAAGPPVFAGLHRASACTPGPQRPGQRTPYTLSWRAATDAETSSSQLVYDIYYATRPDGEDFGSPTWVTQPGVTSFRTPGLPSHGAAYFVVRARDRAGREDRNTVEKAGIDPCL